MSICHSGRAAEKEQDDEHGEDLGGGDGEPGAIDAEKGREGNEGAAHENKAAKDGDEGGGLGALDTLEITHRHDVDGERDETGGKEAQTADSERIGRVGGLEEHLYNPLGSEKRDENYDDTIYERRLH